MKNKLLLTSVLALSFSIKSFAAGIPISDFTNIARLAEQHGLNNQILTQAIEISVDLQKQIDLIGQVKDGEYDKLFNVINSIDESYERFGLKQIMSKPSVNRKGNTLDFSTGANTQKSIRDTFYINGTENPEAASSVDAHNEIKEIRQAAYDEGMSQFMELYFQTQKNYEMLGEQYDEAFARYGELINSTDPVSSAEIQAVDNKLSIITEQSQLMEKNIQNYKRILNTLLDVANDKTIVFIEEEEAS